MEHEKCPTCGQTINLSSIAGKARMANLTSKERSELARRAVNARWTKRKAQGL